MEFIYLFSKAFFITLGFFFALVAFAILFKILASLVMSIYYFLCELFDFLRFIFF